jgi:hypothetical protein
MYVPEFGAGFVSGVVVGWVSLMAFIYAVAERQRRRNRRPK